MRADLAEKRSNDVTPSTAFFSLLFFNGMFWREGNKVMEGIKERKKGIRNDRTDK
jgi:hypothetical protein